MRAARGSLRGAPGWDWYGAIPRRLLVVAMCLWGGCLPLAGQVATPATQPVRHRVEGEASSTVIPVLPELQAEMEVLQAGLARVGFHGLSRLSQRGFLADGDRRSWPAWVPAGRCLLWSVLASRGLGDLDLAVYSSEGEVLAQDERLDARPSIVVCGTHEPVRVYYVLHAYRGAGTFWLQGFVGDVADQARLGGALGAPPVRAMLGAAQDDLQSRLAQLGLRLHQDGYRAVQAPLRLNLRRVQRIRTGVDTTPGHCYVLLATARQPGSGLVVRLLNPQGELLAQQGVGDIQLAEIEFCSSGEQQLVAEAEVPGGGADVELQLYAARVHRLRAVGKRWRVLEPKRAWGGEGLASKESLAEGGQADAASWYGRLGPGQVLEKEVRFPRAGCYRLRMRVASSLQELEAEWFGADVRGPRRQVVCATKLRRARLRLRARRGYGAFACGWKSL